MALPASRSILALSDETLCGIGAQAESTRASTVIVPGAGVLSERAELEGVAAVSGILWSGGQATPFALGSAEEPPRALGESMHLSLIDHASVWFRKDGEIRAVSRAEFRALASRGEIAADVPVFDTSLTRIAQAREGALERPASATWHGRTFFPASAAR